MSQPVLILQPRSLSSSPLARKRWQEPYPKGAQLGVTLIIVTVSVQSAQSSSRLEKYLRTEGDDFLLEVSGSSRALVQNGVFIMRMTILLLDCKEDFFFSLDLPLLCFCLKHGADSQGAVCSRSPLLWQKKKWILFTYSTAWTPKRFFSKYHQMMPSPQSFLDAIILFSLWLSSGTRVLSFMSPHHGHRTPFTASYSQPSRQPTVCAMQLRNGNATSTYIMTAHHLFPLWSLGSLF